MKLNLGCGMQIKKDYVNLDCRGYDGVDVVHDLETFPYPFENNTFKEVFCSHVLEHLDKKKLPEIMAELKRICKKGAIIKIYLPHFSAGDTYRDPTHLSGGYSALSFEYFTNKPNYVDYFLPKFEILTNRVNFLGHIWYREGMKYRKIISFIDELLSFIPNLSLRYYERFFAWIYPCYEVYVELEVLK